VNPERVAWVVLGVGGVLAGGAIWAGPNEGTAAPLAAGALAALAGFAGLMLWPYVHLQLPSAERLDADSLVALRRAFGEGALGRQRVAQAVLELERESLGRAVAHEGDPVARHPEGASDAEFRRWVRARLDEIEGST
jgi:hypothetical protein